MLKKRLIIVESIAYVIFFLLIIRRIVGNGLFSLETQAFEKTRYEMALWVLLTAIFLLIAHNRSILRNLQAAWSKNWFILIFIVFALCSILWSTNTIASIYKGICLLGCSAIAAYTGLAYSHKSPTRCFWWFFLFVTVSTYIAALFFPAVGTHIGYPYYGAWRGIFWSKNYMGPIAAVGNLVFLVHIYLSWKKKPALFGNILLYLLTAVLVILSKCATALILLVILNLGFLLVLAWVRWKHLLNRSHYIIAGVVAALLIIIFFLNLNFFLGLIGRDATLTGRYPLWSYLIHYGWTNHPILGSGFGATWESNNFRDTTGLAVKWNLTPLVSDNGYIDMFLDLGVVGLVLSIGVILFSLLRAASHAFKQRTVISFFPLLLMVFVIIANLDLSFILNLEFFSWFLMIFALFSTTPLPTGRQVESIPVQKDP